MGFVCLPAAAKLVTPGGSAESGGGVVLLIVVVAARLLVPLTIPRYPLPGILAALLLDAADESIYQWATGYGLRDYQTFDKALDIYYLTLGYVATLRNWRGGFIFQVGRALWYIRLIGVALFEVTGVRWLLVVFANTFEYFFVIVEYIKTTRNPFILPRAQIVRIVAFLWIGIKLPQEWWLHVAQRDFTDTLKRVLFAVPADSPWLEAVRSRPEGLAVPVAAVAVLLALFHLWDRHLPPKAWASTYSADEQTRRMGWPLQPKVALPVSDIGWPLVEKVVLVALVTLIFGELLPGERNAAQLLTGVTLVIATSLIINRVLSSRRVTWGSTAMQFLVMAGVNALTGIIAGILLATPGTYTPLSVFLFLVGLLTLIVVLFDHYTQMREQRG